MKFNFWRKTSAQQAQPQNKDFGFFGYLFKRIEILLLILMGIMAYNMHDLFVGYISQNATFIADKTGKFYFATRLIGSLLLVEIILALATAYFRSRNEWDKSLFTAFVALVIAVANHFTIVELFKDFAEQISNEARTAIEWKMILTNALVFVLGEAIGFVMHSKGNEPAEQAPSWFVNFAQHQNASPTHYGGLVDKTGNPITAQHEPQQAQPLQTVIGFQMKGNTLKTEQAQEPAPRTTANRKPRGKSIDHARVNDLLDKGLTATEIAQIMKCTESSIYKIKAQRNNTL